MRIGEALLPLATIQTVFHLSDNLLAGSIATDKSHLGQLVATHLGREVAGQRSRLGAQRQRQRAAMRLTCLVGNIGLNDEVIEHRLTISVIRQHHRHIDNKGAILFCLGITLVHHIFCQATARIAVLPVARPVHPPEGHAAAHGIMHLGTLYGHTAIGHGTGQGMHDVASLIG